MLSDHEIQRAVGLTDSTTAMFIKQYGERRTGTNVIRALITGNFVNVFVLMHILGDKHGMPADLEQLRASVEGTPDAAWQFARTATFSHKADTTKWGEYFQLRFLKAIHQSLFAAFSEDRLRYLISVRDPYRWAAGFLQHLDWPPGLQRGSWEHEAALGVLSDACGPFNQRHEAWLALHKHHGARSFIVQAESLSHKSSDVLREIEERFGLTRVHPQFVPMPRTVNPTYWDFNRSRSNEDWFDLSGRASRFELSEAMHDVVTNRIDWDTMASFGYRPTSFRTESAA